MSAPTEQNLVAIESELPPPAEPKRKDKKWRPHPREGAQTRRGPPRPYRRVPEDVLSVRIQKLTTRMERAKKQVRRLTVALGASETKRLTPLACLAARGRADAADQVLT
jgi:hypothetical protein